MKTFRQYLHTEAVKPNAVAKLKASLKADIGHDSSEVEENPHLVKKFSHNDIQHVKNRFGPKPAYSSLETRKASHAPEAEPKSDQHYVDTHHEYKKTVAGIAKQQKDAKAKLPPANEPDSDRNARWRKENAIRKHGKVLGGIVNAIDTIKRDSHKAHLAKMFNDNDSVNTDHVTGRKSYSPSSVMTIIPKQSVTASGDHTAMPGRLTKSSVLLSREMLAKIHTKYTRDSVLQKLRLVRPTKHETVQMSKYHEPRPFKDTFDR